ncbi:MAG: hypothetical protein H7210_12340 [Pyrinomonadaceae bacterium]|nr:hypothetical protein [Phycisphaerales bacterium]
MQAGLIAWQRDALKGESVVVLGEIFRTHATRLLNGVGHDRLAFGAIGAIAQAVRDECREPRRFMLSGIQVCVSGQQVEMKRIEP